MSRKQTNQNPAHAFTSSKSTTIPKVSKIPVLLKNPAANRKSVKKGRDFMEWAKNAPLS